MTSPIMRRFSAVITWLGHDRAGWRRRKMTLTIDAPDATTARKEALRGICKYPQYSCLELKEISHAV